MRRKAIFRQRQGSLWLSLIFVSLFCQATLATESDLLISEIMYDASGSDSGHEWLEIYNSGAEDVIASSTWRFFDGTNHNINLYQGTSTIASDNYFVLADNAETFLLDYPNYQGILFDTVMSLPNSSSSVALSFDGGLTHSSETIYDSAWGGGDGFSLEKLAEFWQTSCVEGGSPGLANDECQIDEPPEDEDFLPEEIRHWSQLIINELMPNPAGSDDGEWIELYNQGPEILNLEGLKIKDNSTRVFTLDTDSNINLNLLANNYLLLPKSVTGISLNNSSGDAVIIMDTEANIIQTVEYNGTALEGRSYANSKNAFVWTKTPTPGQSNQISTNQTPVAQIAVEANNFVVGEKISFSASSSYDPDGEDLDYLWEFGDEKNSNKENIKHSFDKLGSYTIRLTVTDSEGASDSAEFLLDIKQPSEVLENKTTKVDTQKITIDLAEDDLIISEFVPNPVGSDDNEWIELYNNSDKDIDLYGWQLDDQDGGSKPYVFASSTLILAKDFLVLDRAQTKITLNNSSDAVRILTPQRDIWQEIAYEKIPEGKSYAWDSINNEWNISEPSPGGINIFESAEEEKNMYGVAEINDLEVKSQILLQGVAINNISSNDRSLYLADYNFSEINFEEIAEIYSYYKTWPDVKVGDLVTVQGELGKAGNLPRIKIKTAQDIWKNDLSIDYSKPGPVELENIDEDMLGAFINVRAMVVKKSGSNIYLASDIEEEATLRVYTKFSTKDLEIKKGDEIIVAGMLSETDSGFKLSPFGISDIAVSKTVLGAKIEAGEDTETTISTSTSQVLVDNRKTNIRKILFLLVGSCGILALIYTLKKRNSREFL